jgi:predicted nucleic acid-binding protein
LTIAVFIRPFDSQDELKVYLETQAKLFIQTLIKSSKVELASSYVLLFENSRNPYESRKLSIRSFLVYNTSCFVSEEQNDEVIRIATPIIETGIKKNDAFHVASAIVSKCDYFITTDKRLLKYTDERIKLMNPIDFLDIWEEDK